MKKHTKERKKHSNSDETEQQEKQNLGKEHVLKLISITMTVVLALYMSYYQWSHAARRNFITLASKEHLSSKVRHEVPCSEDYSKETFYECKPSQCGRVVMDGLVSKDDTEHLLRMAKKGLSYGGSKGGASILDLHSGALSMGDNFVNIYKFAAPDGPLFTEEDLMVYSPKGFDSRETFWCHVKEEAASLYCRSCTFTDQQISNMIKALFYANQPLQPLLDRKVKRQIHQAISSEFGVPFDSLYLTKPTFFSRMNTTPPHTIHDEYWHIHVDKETYGSFHYTSLLYLSTYKEDFEGGRFVFVDENFNKTVEPRLGRVSFFTSGSENPHFVERLEDGERYAITVSFTCDPDKAIADP